MAKEIASLMVQCTWIEEPEVYPGYEFVCLTPNVHRDQEGNITPSVVTVIPFVWKGENRVQLPVNNETGAQHYVIRRYGSYNPEPATSIYGSTVISQNGARFDLVAKSDVTVKTTGGVTTYTYADNKILAVQYITATKDGLDGSGAAITEKVFKRADSKPKAPEGGTYTDTIPSGWYDEPPAGNELLWISVARFLPNTVNPDWSDPKLVVDSAGVEVIWSTKETPGTPDKTRHPYEPVPNDNWSKEATGATWMAVAVQNNGVWSDWKVVRVKGEAGKGIDTITNYYAVSASKTVAPTTWYTTPPAMTPTLKYLWGYESIKYTDGTIKNTDKRVIGVYGDKGDTGDNAVDYRLVVNPDQLQYDLNSSKYVTNTVTVGVKKVDGNDGITQVALSALGGLGLKVLYRFLKTDGTYDGVFREVLNGTVSCGTKLYTRVEFSLTKNNVEIDSATVAIDQFGKNGTNGRNGVYVPAPMLWDDYPSDYAFKCGNVEDGETHMDMVLVKDVTASGVTNYKIRRCRVSHVKSDAHNPATDVYDPTLKPKGYWEDTLGGGIYSFIATDLFWGNIARIEFFNSQAIRIGYSVDDMWGYFGMPTDRTRSGATFYTGADNPTDASFVVYGDGRVKATNIQISGSSTFRGFVFKQKFEVTAANYASVTKSVYQGTWNGSAQYAKILDLENTGSWIEVKSLPSNYNEVYFAVLPSIKQGLAYTDAYRDSVRQYMGNELMIYNSTNEQLNIEAGETSVIIRPHMACRFKMVFDNVQSGDLWLERIKWEWSTPFQF